MKYIYLIFPLVCLVACQVDIKAQVDKYKTQEITEYKPGLIFPVQVDSVTTEHDTLTTWKLLRWGNLLRFDSTQAWITLDSLGVRMGAADSSMYLIDTTLYSHGQTILSYGYLIDTHTSQLNVLDTAITTRVTEWNYYKDRKGTVDTIAMMQSSILQNSGLIDLRVLKTSFTGDTLMSYINVSPSAVRISGGKVDIESNSDYYNTKGRLTTAEGNIYTNTSNITTLTGNVSALTTSVGLKANVTTVDSIRNRVTTAESGIIANANSISGVTSSLLLYAKKDSVISAINLSPGTIRITGSKINIDGNVTFANGYDPSQKTDSTKVVSIIDGTVNANYINALNIIADSIKANSVISSPVITGGSLNIGSGAFTVTSGGALTATNANITGTITATSGSISGSLLTGTINASTINVTNLNASNLTSGYISVDRIQSGSITSDKFVEISNISGSKKSVLSGGGLGLYNGTSLVQLDNNGSAAQITGDLHVVGTISSEYGIQSSDLIGTVSTARLGTGTASSSTYLRGDGTWATVSGGSGGTVTSVACSSASTAALTVSGSPITSSGTFVFSIDDDLVDLADGSLSGSKVGSGINATNITTGTLPSARLNGVYGSATAGYASNLYDAGSMDSYTADSFAGSLTTSGNTIRLTNNYGTSIGSAITVPYATTAGNLATSANNYNGSIWVDSDGDNVNDLELTVTNGLIKN